MGEEEKLDLNKINMNAFKEKVLRGDGHSIFIVSHYEDVGFPPGFLPIERHHSGTTPKSMIIVNGEPVPYMDGVYHLELLHKICAELGLKYQSAMGRGFQAQNYVHAINEHLNQITKITND